eukprot:1157965-Pelagomonas_calceolata.AAC.7
MAWRGVKAKAEKAKVGKGKRRQGSKSCSCFAMACRGLKAKVNDKGRKAAWFYYGLERCEGKHGGFLELAVDCVTVIKKLPPNSPFNQGLFHCSTQWSINQHANPQFLCTFSIYAHRFRNQSSKM